MTGTWQLFDFERYS